MDDYRRSEVQVGLSFLIILSIYTLLLIPNDLLFIQQPVLLATSIALRVASSAKPKERADSSTSRLNRCINNLLRINPCKVSAQP